MSIRDLLLNILIGFGVCAFILFVIAVDSLPIWILVIAAIVVWVVYIVIVVRDHSRDIRYPILRYRPDKIKGAINQRLAKTPQTTPYNQEEDEE